MLLFVFPKPRTIDSEPALYEAAIKILMRRAHSVYEMKKALIRRTADEDLIKKVIDRLKRENLIDDARYAKQFARHRTEFRKQGKFLLYIYQQEKSWLLHHNTVPIPLSPVLRYHSGK